MNNKDNVRDAARLLGSRGGKSPKTITDADRQRRREWAAGLAAKRAAKRAAAFEEDRPAIKVRIVVIDRQGQRWAYYAESVNHAITLARTDGIDAVAGRAEVAKQEGEQ